MKKTFAKRLAVLGLSGMMGFGVFNGVIANQTAPVAQAAFTQQGFLTQLWPSAQGLSAKYGIYPSVMIAQAMLESNYGNSKLGLAPNYNLFGIKGDYNGQSVSYQTKEWRTNHYETVVQKFKKYPNLYASMEDNANKLRYGVSWQPTRYNGAWFENTNSYKDATLWLTGRYATAPDYNLKLNNLITKFNLTQYDPKVASTKGTITLTSATATYNMPFGPQQSNGDWYGKGRTLNYDKVVTLYNGTTAYRVGTNKWINGTSAGNSVTQAPKYAGVVKVNVSARLYTTAGGGQSTRVLSNGTEWKYFSTKKINNVTWYNLGGNQWVSGNNVVVK